MLDFADAIQSGSAARFGCCATTMPGTSKTAVRSPHASPAGVVGVQGAAVPPAKPTELARRD